MSASTRRSCAILEEGAAVFEELLLTAVEEDGRDAEFNADGGDRDAFEQMALKRVNIQATSVPLTVNTGSGDAVAVTSTSNTLDPINAAMINDTTGTSTVTGDDSGYGGNESYLITRSTVTIGGFVLK